MGDDFLTAINYSIREEIVERFFRERRITENEIALYSEDLTKLKNLAGRVGRLISLLNHLLGPSSQVFWNRLGAYPVQSFEPASYGTTFFAAGSILFWRRAYRRQVNKVVQRLDRLLVQYHSQADELIALADEVNHDIDSYNINNDFLLIKSVLARMDVATAEKKRILACSLDGSTCQDLDKLFMFRKVEHEQDALEILSSRPDSGLISEAARSAVDDALRLYPKRVMTLMRRE